MPGERVPAGTRESCSSLRIPRSFSTCGSNDDVKSVISFDLSYSVPKQVARENPDASSALVTSGRLNAHHKQLFFSDAPVFVEGHHDALMVEALMEARGVSAAAAGSCVIECGGVAEVTQYLTLCRTLGKKAHFVYDLDSLFSGRLRSCIGDDNSIRSVLASAGVGGHFVVYVGELDQLLTDSIDTLLSRPLESDLKLLSRYLQQFGPDRKKWNKDQLARARVAVMTAINVTRATIVSEISANAVEDIEGRWQRILTTLAEHNIHVLAGGALERYLPSFSGNLFAPSPEAKGSAVEHELGELQRICQTDDIHRDAALEARYGALYGIVRKLPSRAPVDFDSTLRVHLSDYVHELQKVVAANSDWGREEIARHMEQRPLQKSGVVWLEGFRRDAKGRFDATIGVSEMVGGDRRLLDVDATTTIGNMKEFRWTGQDGAF